MLWKWAALSSVVVAVAERRPLEICKEILGRLNDKNLGILYDAESQFEAVVVLPYCAGLLKNEDATWPLTPLETDELARAFEFVSSFSMKPGSLLAMTRSIGNFAQGCQTGIKYLEPASQFIAVESFARPRSVVYRLGPSDSISSNSDPAYVEVNPMADIAAEFALPRTPSSSSQPSLAHPAAHRFFMGGDRFPQSYSKAFELLQSSASRFDQQESLAMLGMALHYGLGAPADKITARRLLHVAAHKHKSDTALSHLGVSLFDFIAAPQGRLLTNKIFQEARNLFEKAAERNVPLAQQNVVALDLLSGDAVRMKWLLSLSAAVTRGFPIPTHTVAKVTLNDLMGMKTCPQSWALMSRTVRRDLLYSTVVTALDGRGKTALTDLELMTLAASGVEPAEAALASRESISAPAESAAARLKLLAFSAFNGRVASQMKLARYGKLPTSEWNKWKIAGPPPEADESAASSDKLLTSPEEFSSSAATPSLDKILEEWEVYDLDRLDVSDLFSSEEVSYENSLALASQRGRWLNPDESVTEVATTTAEAMTNLAWMSFIGYGCDQNLRDAVLWIKQLTTIYPGYWLMERIYYLLLQIMYSTNYILFTFTLREFAAICVLIICGAVVGLSHLFLK